MRSSAGGEAPHGNGGRGGAALDADGEFLLDPVDRFPLRGEFADNLEQPNPDTLGFLRPSMATGLHRRRCRCHRPVAVDPDTTTALYISVSPAPLCLGPLYWTTARRCRLSHVLVGGISFFGTNKSMAPWFCTRSLVRQPPSDTTGMCYTSAD